ncbi:hypothetical protein SEA_KEELAN_78 [Gordonia phage Keelan]|nr:hypothetical protein SEA_KEELAN_78 [Gordonia phage Keelan]
MKVEVTQEDIDLGKPGDPKSCPISRAIQRKRGVVRATTMPGEAYVTRPDRWTYYKMPRKAMQFVLDFDQLKSVEPFTFETKPRYSIGR